MAALDFDPLALGYVTNLARPTGNVTGVFLQQIELSAKRVQLLTHSRHQQPNLLHNSTHPSNSRLSPSVRGGRPYLSTGACRKLSAAL
jgi:hypothetical protein